MISEFEGIVGAVVGFFLIIASIFITHKFDEAAYADLKATTATAYADAQKTYSDALAAQIASERATERRNDQISASLAAVQNDAASAHRDADFAQRLLAAAAKTSAPAGSPPVPATGSAPGAPAAGAALGDRRAGDLSGLTAGAIAECRNAIERLSAIRLKLNPAPTP
jgi:hypothetical protein